ncbi:AMP-binding protein [Nitrospinae bacterium AH_259_B05_G02_I21]|nr:AMP-binding protein [Nitrospinae bacterium AH_259_B05_G02_I21]
MIRSIPARVAESVERFRGRPALKVRRDGGPFETITYGELWEEVLEVATGLVELGVGPGDHVALISDNRPEWIATNLAVLTIGAADVPRGGDTTPEELAYILPHSDAVAAFFEDRRQWDKWEAVRERAPAVRHAVVIDPEGLARDDVLSYAELRGRGAARRAEGDRQAEELMGRIAPEDLATIIYTSGTTGTPKGVMLTHANMLHNIRSVPALFHLTEHDRYLSILPSWHSFERIIEYVLLSVGASLAYSRPARPVLLKDIAEERPTFIVAVPRIWEALYQGIMTELRKAPPARRRVAQALLGAARAHARARNRLAGREPIFEEGEDPGAWGRLTAHLVKLVTGGLYAVAERILLPRLRAVTGGHLRAAVSGGAHLPPTVDEFFDTLGIKILEGYGLTETAPVACSRSFDRAVIHTVGRPLPEVEVKIIDPETGGTLPAGAKGVVHIRGPNIMAGYYKDPEATRQAVDAEGWLDTGDLGRLTVGGDLQIVGRAKDTIVLSSGENLEPDPIEARLKESPYIAQVCVVGHDEKNLGALIVPNAEAVARTVGLAEEDPEAVAAHPEAHRLIKGEVRRLVSAEGGFKPHEHVTTIALLASEFTPGRELTHTLKMRRGVIHDLHAETIEKLYRRGR